MKKLIMLSVSIAFLVQEFSLASYGQALPRSRFTFSANLHSKGVPAQKEWTRTEKTTVERHLSIILRSYPNLVTISTRLLQLHLIRVKTLSSSTKWPLVTAGWQPGNLAFTDLFFAFSKEKQLKIILHELTHAADPINTTAYGKDWQQYFERNKEFLKIFSDDSSLEESLADTLPKFLLGENIPERHFFEQNIANKLLHPNNLEQEACAHFLQGRVYFDNQQDDLSLKEMYKVIEIRPEALKARYILSLSLERIKQVRDALGETKRSIQIIDSKQLPDGEQIRIAFYRLRGLLLIEADENLDEAKRILTLVLNRRPADKAVRKLLSSIEYTENRLQRNQSGRVKDMK